MGRRLEYEDFSTRLHSKFRIRLSDDKTIEAELAEITEHMVSPRQERFAIVFLAPNEFLLEQGIWQIEHDDLEALDLFLVPIGRDEEGTRYEAVFNRLVKK